MIKMILLFFKIYFSSKYLKDRMSVALFAPLCAMKAASDNNFSYSIILYLVVWLDGYSSVILLNESVSELLIFHV